MQNEQRWQGQTNGIFVSPNFGRRPLGYDVERGVMFMPGPMRDGERLSGMRIEFVDALPPGAVAADAMTPEQYAVYLDKMCGGEP